MADSDAPIATPSELTPTLPVGVGARYLRRNESVGALGCTGLVKRYRGRRVVDDVSLRVEPGEVVGLLGPNGAGKTTTFYMIVGLIRPDAGRVSFGERDISSWPMYVRARRGIGYLPQEPSVFRKLTVWDNIMAIIETTSIRWRDRKTRCTELLEALDVAHLAKSQGYQLSGGERRRVEIARALVTEPAYLLLDEPFAGVDPIAVEDIQRVIAQLKAAGIAVLITDHNVRETLSIVDRAYIMADGKLWIEGTASELANNPEARRLYLGERFAL